MWHCVDLVWTDVSEKRIASIFRVEKFASEEPAWAGGCRLSHHSKTPSYIRTGREGEWTTWEINREERGRVGLWSWMVVDVGHPLWREDGSVIYHCCWTSPVQSFSGLSPTGLMSIFFTVSDSRLPQPGGPGPHISIPQEQGGPVIPPGTGFPFHRVSWLTGLCRRYWTHLHMGKLAKF
jgi:hypothetical protein